MVAVKWQRGSGRRSTSIGASQQRETDGHASCEPSPHAATAASSLLAVMLSDTPTHRGREKLLRRAEVGTDSALHCRRAKTR